MPRWPDIRTASEGKVLALFDGGASIKVAARLAGVGGMTARKWIMESGRNSSRGKTHKQLDSDSIFQNIDTEEKAYWLGFLMADGGRNRNAIDLRLATKDRGHLQRYAAFLGDRVNVRDYSYPYAKFSMVNVRSAQLSADLDRQGFTKPNIDRTFRADLGDLMWHYLRGIFDGDGCAFVSYRGKAHNRVGLCFVGYPTLLLGVKRFLSLHVDAESVVDVKVAHSDVAWYVIVNRQASVHEIAKRMYGGATVFLERKKNILQYAIDNEYVDKRKRAYVN